MPQGFSVRLPGKAYPHILLPSKNHEAALAVSFSLAKMHLATIPPPHHSINNQLKTRHAIRFCKKSVVSLHFNVGDSGQKRLPFLTFSPRQMSNNKHGTTMLQACSRANLWTNNTHLARKV